MHQLVTITQLVTKCTVTNWGNPIGNRPGQPNWRPSRSEQIEWHVQIVNDAYSVCVTEIIVHFRKYTLIWFTRLNSFRRPKCKSTTKQHARNYDTFFVVFASTSQLISTAQMRAPVRAWNFQNNNLWLITYCHSYCLTFQICVISKRMHRSYWHLADDPAAMLWRRLQNIFTIIGTHF